MYSIEVCAGAGGQALGLERAGFEHLDLVEIDEWACKTLRTNRPSWRVSQGDLRDFDASKYRGVDLFAGGLPCPPFSVAGKQLGANDERNLFPIALEHISQCRPRAVLIENVRGMLDPSFNEYREWIVLNLRKQGFGYIDWQIQNACDFGVPQQRPRLILLALRGACADKFVWPSKQRTSLTVGGVLHDLMAANGWKGVRAWQHKANEIAPTIVGGSKKHGGPDLGPTRARRKWAQLGVDGLGVADEAPSSEQSDCHIPKLTIRMIARLQGFADSWSFAGRKTHAYRQVGNAFPWPVAAAVGSSVAQALGAEGAVLAA